MSSQRDLHDHYFREAKRNGYRSRAAYKLIEINEKRNLLKKGDCVLDLGAAPGSWLQVASEQIGSRGKVVGVDLTEIEGSLPENVTTIQDDVMTLHEKSFDGITEFDVILSDMAPNTTGTKTIDHHGSMRLCHCALDLAATILKSGGNLVMKVLEGEAYPELLDRAAESFSTAKGFKPKASRSISTEMYVVCINRNENVEKPLPMTNPPPSSGWG
ncbi:MAG: RlmE family RNA methyltransferase [Planctomycetota bacterium]|nr:RlmE family RNA methyltransferase [Planctomycetota bacterium]